MVSHLQRFRSVGITAAREGKTEKIGETFEVQAIAACHLSTWLIDIRP
jgi:hypothetical protein